MAPPAPAPAPLGRPAAGRASHALPQLLLPPLMLAEPRREPNKGPCGAARELETQSSRRRLQRPRLLGRTAALAAAAVGERLARRRRELDATQRRSVELRITVATDVPMNRLHVPSSAARAKQRCQSRWRACRPRLGRGSADPPSAAPSVPCSGGASTTATRLRAAGCSLLALL